MTILIVDDIQQTELIDSFINEGHSVLTAEDGHEALLIYNSHKIDWIITDLNMPNMDGLELTKEIMKTNKDMKVILYSQAKENGLTFLARRFGAREFVPDVTMSKIHDAMKRLREASDNLNIA